MLVFGSKQLVACDVAADQKSAIHMHARFSRICPASLQAVTTASANALLRNPQSAARPDLGLIPTHLQRWIWLSPRCAQNPSLCDHALNAAIQWFMRGEVTHYETSLYWSMHFASTLALQDSSDMRHSTKLPRAEKLRQAGPLSSLHS